MTAPKGDGLSLKSVVSMCVCVFVPSMTGGGGERYSCLFSAVFNFLAPLSGKSAVFKSISAFEFHSMPSISPSKSSSSFSSSFACVCGMVRGGMEREKGGTVIFAFKSVFDCVCVCGVVRGGMVRGGIAMFVCICVFGMVSGGMERERRGGTLTFVCTFVFGLAEFVVFKWRAAKDDRLGEADVELLERVEREERGGKEEVVVVVVVVRGDALEFLVMFSCVLVMLERDWSVCASVWGGCCEVAS